MVDNKIIEEYYATRSANARGAACYVPFSHMFFSFNGAVHNCCFSGKQSYLGRWPENSIREIWFGGSFERLRKAIQLNDFTLGCESCGQRIMERDFENVGAKSYDHYADSAKLNRTGFPEVMEFELDNDCNLECVMCDGRFSSSIRRNREKLPSFSSPYNYEFVKQLEEFIPHLRKALFYGGEPFMVKIYFDMWATMLELNPQIEIRVQTNGTFLNQRIKAILEQGRFHINVSLDAVDKRVFEEIRVNSNFERVIGNTQYFMDYCKYKGTDFTISPSPIIQSWQEVPKLLNWANKKMVYVVYNIVSFPKSLSLRSLPSIELKRIYEELDREHIIPENPLEETNLRNYKNYISHIRHLFLQAVEQEQKQSNLSVLSDAESFFERMSKYVRAKFEPGEWAGAEEVINTEVTKILNEAELNGSYHRVVQELKKTEPEMIIKTFPHKIEFEKVKVVMSELQSSC